METAVEDGDGDGSGAFLIWDHPLEISPDSPESGEGTAAPGWWSGSCQTDGGLVCLLSLTRCGEYLQVRILMNTACTYNDCATSIPRVSLTLPISFPEERQHLCHFHPRSLDSTLAERSHASGPQPDGSGRGMVVIRPQGYSRPAHCRKIKHSVA